MRVLVTGSQGQLGSDVTDLLHGRLPPGGRYFRLFGGPPVSGLDVVAVGHGELAVEDRLAVLGCVDAVRPDVVVHAAAYTAVDACEDHSDQAFAVNALGTRNIAEACRHVGAHLVYVSTDYVFDGRSERPYREWDEPNPLSVYGASKLAGERECPPGSTIIRTSWVCGARGQNMVKTALRLARGDGPMRFVNDQHGSPTFTADLAAGIVTLGLDRRPGTFHVTNQGATTWFAFVRAVVEVAGFDPSRVEPISTAELTPPRLAVRPANSVLDNAALRLARLPLLAEWHDGLERLVGALAQEDNVLAMSENR